MTYTSSLDSYAFFVVGGNASGTDTGRVYLACRIGYPYVYGLLDTSHNPTYYLNWTHESWTSDTMIVLGNTLAAFDGQFFDATLDEMVAAGIGGSILYDSVVTI